MEGVRVELERGRFERDREGQKEQKGWGVRDGTVYNHELKCKTSQRDSNQHSDDCSFKEYSLPLRSIYSKTTAFLPM